VSARHAVGWLTRVQPTVQPNGRAGCAHSVLHSASSMRSAASRTVAFPYPTDAQEMAVATRRRAEVILGLPVDHVGRQVARVADQVDLDMGAVTEAVTDVLSGGVGVTRGADGHRDESSPRGNASLGSSGGSPSATRRGKAGSCIARRSASRIVTDSDAGVGGHLGATAVTQQCRMRYL